MQNRGIAVAFVVLVALPLTLRAQSPTDPKVLKSAEKHYKPETKTDAFTKTVTTFLPLEDLEYFTNKEMDCGSGFVRLVAMHTIDPKNGASTILLFHYASRDWMFIGKEATFQVLAGDSVRSFAPIGEPSRDVSSMAQEDQVFQLSSADLAWFASQSNLRARVEGDKLHCDFPLKPEALALLGMFNDRVVQPSAASTASR